jgi:hypothetical protein
LEGRHPRRDAAAERTAQALRPRNHGIESAGGVRDRLRRFERGAAKPLQRGDEAPAVRAHRDMR